MHRSFARGHKLGLALLLCMLVVAPVAGAAVPAHAQAATVPGTWDKGFVMIGYGADPYKITNVPASLASLKATGANSVSFAPIWFMTDGNATTIAPSPEHGTPSDESLVAAIRAAHGLGLRVMLRPYIDLFDGSWRADITPKDPNAWFASYTSFENHYLAIARTEGVEEYTVGVELINMTEPQFANQWRALIAQSRARYSGQLTYSANWGKSTRNEYKQITWWDALDFIGLSAYFPLSLQDYPSVDQMVAGWTTYTDQVGDVYHWVNEIKAVSDQFHKPVVFTEIGFGSYSNAPARWDMPQHVATLSLETQDRAIEATLRVWSQQSWFHGVYWWHWEPYVGGGGPTDLSDTINNKPAVATITRWYGGSGGSYGGGGGGGGSSDGPIPLPTGTPRPAPAAGTAGVNNPAFNPVASPGPDTSTAVYFAQTGHTLTGGFLAYWQQHGGLSMYGYPISEPYLETSPTDGKAYAVQYFERQRFEYHPEAPAGSKVLLGLLGVALVNGRTTGAFAPVPSPGPDTATRVYFAPTAHTLSDRFLAYWNRYGGLAQFGYPLSEPFREVSTTDNKTYLVQYFQRARFEYHPENAGTFYEVLLGFLGRWYAGKP